MPGYIYYIHLIVHDIMRGVDYMNNDIVIFRNGELELEVSVSEDRNTVWLSLDQMAELFSRDKSTISRHIRNMFNEGELDKTSTIRNFLTVQNEGNRTVKRNIEYYNLDLIIAVGYRTNSKKATKFRQWATEVLKSYIIKGYSINKEKLKNPNKYGKDYFDKLLEIIKEIRTRERSLVLGIFQSNGICHNI